MDQQLVPKFIGNYLIKKGTTIKQLEKEAEELKEILISSVPENLKEWLNEDLIISNLFEYGKSSRKLYFGRGDYGFRGENDIRKKMKELSENWKDVVLIKIKKSEPHRIEVKLNVVY